MVTTGIQDDTYIEVLTGLTEGDEVITGPYNTDTKMLESGDKIKQMSEKDESEEEE